MLHDIDPCLDGPGKDAQIRIFEGGKDRAATMRWGFAPIELGGRPVSLLRAENWEVRRPCLVPANEFALKQEGKVKYRAKLITSQPFFCLAGMWRPATHDWPPSFAVLTVPAYPDIEPYKERHVAVLRPEDWFNWLREARPRDEMLHPFPLGSFEIIGAPKKKAVGDLFS
jgi:putative SOS response-associated peptidase YedK